MAEEEKRIDEKITSLLADHIGVEEGEIDKNDSFRDDLHMSSVDLADFLEKLAEEGFNTSSLDLSSIENVGELIDTLISQQELG